MVNEIFMHYVVNDWLVTTIKYKYTKVSVLNTLVVCDVRFCLGQLLASALQGKMLHAPQITMTLELCGGVAQCPANHASCITALPHVYPLVVLFTRTFAFLILTCK